MENETIISGIAHAQPLGLSGIGSGPTKALASFCGISIDAYYLECECIGVSPASRSFVGPLRQITGFLLVAWATYNLLTDVSEGADGTDPNIKTPFDSATLATIVPALFLNLSFNCLVFFWTAHACRFVELPARMKWVMLSSNYPYRICLLAGTLAAVLDCVGLALFTLTRNERPESLLNASAMPLGGYVTYWVSSRAPPVYDIVHTGRVRVTVIGWTHWNQKGKPCHRRMVLRTTSRFRTLAR